MKLVLIFCTVAITAWTCLAAPADDLIAQGRAYLAARDLTNANARFASAVAADGNHSTANVFRASTRLLTLADQAAGKALLDRLGMGPTNRSVYGWTADLAHDTNGIVQAPANMSAAELSAFLRTNILVEIAAAGSNLAVVTDPNFALSLTSNETTMVDVTVDYADLLMVRAALRFAQYLGYTIHSWNLDIQFTALRAVMLDQNSTTETFLAQYPNLFTFATTNDLFAARQAFSDAVTLYIGASDIIRSRTNVTRLFNFDPGMAEKESAFRITLDELNRSLNGPVVLTPNTNLTVNFAQHFNPTNPVRSFFPTFAGNAIIAGTFPDATFGGLIQGLPSYEFETAISHHKHPEVHFVSQFKTPRRLQNGSFEITLDALDGAFFAIEVSSNLQSWTNLTVGVVNHGVLGFVDPAGTGLNHRYYRALDLSDVTSVSGAVYDLVTGNPIAGALVSLSFPYSLTPPVSALSDAAGNFVLYSTQAPRYASLQVDVTAAGFAPFQFSGFPYPSSHLSVTAYLGPPGYHPPNDNFAQRLPITGANSTVSGFNVGASREINEPYHAGSFAEHSVWWTWTAPANGAISLDTVGSSFNGVLAVYAGNSLPSLIPIDSDGGSSGNGSSRVEFFVTAGTVYQIAVDSSYDGRTGRIVLNLRSIQPRLPQIVYQPRDQTAIEGNDAFFSVTATGTDPISFQWQHDNVDLPGAVGSYFSIYPVQLSDAGAYRVILGNAAGSTTSSVATLTITPIPRPPNDAFSNRIAITGSSNTVTGFNDNATTESGEPFPWSNSAGQSVWWTWTAPVSGAVTFDTFGSSFPTVLAAYTGDSLPGLAVVAADEDLDGYGYASLDFSATAGVTYQVAVDGAYFGAYGQITLNLQPTASRAPRILSQPASITAIVGDEVFFDVLAVGTDPLSYQWRRNEANLPGANEEFYDISSVQTGDAGNYTVLVTNIAGSATSHVAILTVIVPPPNDAFAGRIAVTGANITLTGSNVNASTEAGEPYHAFEIGGSSVWWAWTAPSNGVVTLDTIGSSFDTLLAVYTGSSVSSLSPEASDNDAGGNGASKLTFTALGGFVYQIAVDGYYGASGDIVLHLRQAPPTPLDFWTSQNSTTANDLVATAFGNGQFVAVGNSAYNNRSLFTSPDGSNWIRRTWASSDPQPYVDCVEYLNGLFVAVGSGSMILTSPDATNWTERAQGSQLYGAAYGNGRYLAGGSGPAPGRVLSSINGTNWTELAGDSHIFRSIAFGAGLFAATAYTYVSPNYFYWIVTSPDGTNWTVRYSQTNGFLDKMRYLNGQFIAVGDTILTSANGINWTTRSFPTSGPTSLQDVAYGDGAYVAVGYNYSAPQPILTSTDGLNWTPRSAGTTQYLLGVSYGKRRFVAVGFNGVIFTSGTFQN